MAKIFFGTFLAICVSTILANLPTKIDEAILAKYSEECKAESGYDFDKSAESQMLETPNPLANCYIKCFSIKTGLVNDKGEPQSDKVNSVFDIPVGMDIDKVVKKCYEDHKDKADICEKVGGSEKCIIIEIRKFAAKS